MTNKEPSETIWNMQAPIPLRNLTVVRNLFGSPQNAVLTVLAVTFLVLILPPIIEWAILDSVWLPADRQACARAEGACWAFVQAKLRVILFGRYPIVEQWRPIVAMILLLLSIVVSADWRQWKRQHWLWVLATLWVTVIVIDAVLMAGGAFGLERVEVDRWGGLPLTLMLAVFGITFAFIIGIFLALGRMSDLLVIRWFSVGYIELIRGVPLITILFMAVIMLPLLLPADVAFPKLLKAELAFIIFFSAYIAEAIRGGLQGLPKEQYVAAESLALSYWQSMRRIILPQALRAAIPSIVNIFLNAFKDTSLVVIIGMMDLLGTTMAVLNDPEWFGVFIEPYIFTAVLYFSFCMLLSWYSQRLEQYLRTN